VKKLLMFLFSGVLTLVFVVPSHAIPIYGSFSGQVSAKYGAAPAPAGATVVGEFSFDSGSVPDTGTDNALYQSGTFVNVPGLFSLTITSGSSSWTFSSTAFNINLRNDIATGGGESFQLIANSWTVTPSVPATPQYMQIKFIGGDDQMLSSDQLGDLLAFNPALAPISMHTIRSNTPNYWYENFTISQFQVSSGAATAVPEPTTLLLLGSGLVGLAGLGRKKFFRKC
jgi:hypothetical protein